MHKRKPGACTSAADELRHFTNRETEQATFRRLLDLPTGSTLPVLMFYGVGGNGKSWLLRRLRELLEEIPSARLDLDPNPGIGGTSYHTDSSRALAEIRRQLGADCPRFDLAYAMIRFKEGAGNDPLFSHGASGLAWEFIEQVAQTVASFPGGNILLWLSKKASLRLKDTALGEWLLSNAGNDDFLHLRRLDPQDIYPLLAERLAIDLEERLPPREGKVCQAVVFLDTFEALQRGVPSAAHQKEREAWVRELYQKLTNVLLVIAGRDRLDWDELDPDWQKPEHLEQHLVGGLSRRDAETFLSHHAIGPGSLRAAVLRVSQDEGALGAEAYHPYSLGLCADTITNERAQGREPQSAAFALSAGDFSALADRFLRSLPDRAHETWVIRLAQTPRFDETAARTILSSTSGIYQDAAWEQLLDFSFLQRSLEDRGWFRLHPRMTEALRHRLLNHADELRRSHESWRGYWDSRAREESDTYASLSWYHLLHLEPSEALGRWRASIESARKHGRMMVHYQLLSWWETTDLQDRVPQDPWTACAFTTLGRELSEATLGNRTRNLQRAIASFISSLRVYTQADFPAEWATTQNYLGNAYQNLPTGDRGENLQRAIACYKAALRVYTETDFPTDWATTQNNLGNAYRYLPSGDRRLNLEKAIVHLTAALRVRTEAGFPADWAATQNNLGNVYRILPTKNRGRNLERAIVCFTAALRVFTEAAFPSQWATTQNHLGNAYRSLPKGDCSQNLQKAIDCYEATLRVRTEAEFPTDWATIQNNLGVAHAELPTGDRGENLKNAIACLSAALRVRTEVDFPSDWAITQGNLGIVFERSGQMGAAREAYESAARGYRLAGLEDEARGMQEWASRL